MKKLSWNQLQYQLPLILKKLKMNPIVSRNLVNKQYNFKSGIYVFFENNKPLYVGMTKRKIAKRVLIHSRPSSSHNSASFAFLLSKDNLKIIGNDLSRKKLIGITKFKRIFQKQKRRIGKMKVKAIQIQNPELRAVFEIYASKKFNTPYNEFDTH